MFGHSVVLNFNQKGETYNTVIGGITGIVIKVLLALYLWQKANVLYYKSSNTIGLWTETIDGSDLG